MSAEDYLLLFLNGGLNQNDTILKEVKKLKRKGVHVIIIGLTRENNDIAEFYEKVALYPSDVNFIDTVVLKHVVADLTAISCRKVSCESKRKPDIKNEGIWKHLFTTLCVCNMY